ncbi:hypothetical protein [Enhygromyxa salina]|uniref:Uncharacterized protein n=1 Tax=Enhygromyxa salina TaxID=215803 RepID=A0A2S9Y2M2_9BACT|nr:hypothetical protein [Enhygromyxa salina]PRP99354.1 hypothetical protein ENSA7_63960 [Enhygromyxa salina]
MQRNHLTLMLLVASVASLPSSASASTHRNLCMSAPTHCTPTGTQVPRLDASVCLSRSGELTIRGTAPCPADAWPYYLEHGEVVDPTTGQVNAYLPLDDACSQAGMCEKGPPPDGTLEFPMCCYVNQGGEQVCVNGFSCAGTIWYCYDGVSNDDGTVTCFASEQA